MKLNIQQIFSDSFRDSKGNYSDSITDKEIDLLFKHKLFKCFLPEALGGLGLNLPETLQIIEETSYINGSLGWLLQIGNGGMYFVTNFEEKTASKLFSPNDSVISGSGIPTTTAIEEENGYRITGSWRFCSGSAYATLFTLTFYSNNQQEVLSAVVPRSNVKIIQDWDTLGLRSTSTNTIEVEDIFIPHEHTFNILNRKSFLNESVLGLPFILFAQSFFIHVIYGIFHRLLQEAINFLAEKDTLWIEKHPERKRQLETLITSGTALLETSLNQTNAIITQLTDSAYFTNERSEKEFQEKFVQIAKSIRLQSHTIYASLGIEVTYRSHPIAIFYADLLTASQHKLLTE